MTGLERVFPADTEALEKIRNFVGPFLKELPPKRSAHVELAMEEVVVNICSYAYASPPGMITVMITDKADSVSLEFVDDGVPFDPLSMEEPDAGLSMDERGQGGLGILLVRRVIDEIHYRRDDGKNRLTLVVKKNA